MPVYDADDIVEMKKRKKRRQRLIKLFSAIVAAAVAAGLYFTRDTWYPKLRGIGKQYKTVVNSGQLASGKFPIVMSTGTDYQLRYTVKKIMVQSDTYLYIYDTNGTLLKKRQHDYSNTILRVANGRALVYESGGYRFSVEDEDDVFYSREFDDNILFARLSSQGYTAVVTTYDNYSCRIIVYNRKGKEIYQRKCIDPVSDISFIDDSDGCMVTYIKAENGAHVTTVQKIDFSESKEDWTSPGLNTLGLEVFGSDEGAFVYGLDACGYVNRDGQISSFYKYDGDLVAAASISGKSAVVINDSEARKYNAVLFADNSSEALTIPLKTPGVDVSVFKGLAYILTQDGIYTYDFKGVLRSTAAVGDSYTGFVRSDNHIFLKGFNRIDRIDYDT
ncbi:MAG: hypothetical protein IKO47_07555 [Ruminococcus sp.]|nr:hypothetical protein [Ruminococcus sp.]